MLLWISEPDSVTCNVLAIMSQHLNQVDIIASPALHVGVGGGLKQYKILPFFTLRTYETIH